MGASVGRQRPSNGFIWFHCISVFGIAQRAFLVFGTAGFSMGIATLEQSQAPARQGHFVVTVELPEIQTVTVWTPCCVFVDTILIKKVTCKKWLYPVPIGWTFDALKNLLRLLDAKLLWVFRRWCYTKYIPRYTCTTLCYIRSKMFGRNRKLYLTLHRQRQETPSHQGQKSWTYWHENSLLILWFFCRMTD